MRVVVNATAHFAMTPDRALWIDSASMGYSFWTRYLDVFDEVDLLVRAHPVAEPPDGWNRATGHRITAAAVPDSVGPWGFARNYWRIARTIRSVIADAEAVLLRLPCHIGAELWRRLPQQRPYGIEVASDPYDVFSKGANTHPLRPLFRRWSTLSLRSQCAGACAAAYVTENVLQRRYPPARNAFALFCSDVLLRTDSFAAGPRTIPPRSPFKLVFVGSLAQPYKGLDVLIDAVAECVRRGLDIRLHVLGDGKHRPDLERRAAAMGMGERIDFRGQVAAGEMVQQELDWADLFVLPSLTEGLPRALIEAMARALPSIGSSVGGIPELLPLEDLVPSRDAGALARKISEVLTDPARMSRMSRRNLTKAREYDDAVLRSRRISVYRHLRTETSRWLQARAA
jgi:glycosyltransferase involved in cell wall biosynthesis